MLTRNINRKDYLPPAFSVDIVELNFDLYDEHALVINRMVLRRQHPGPLYLHGDELQLVSIELNGEPLSDNDYQFSDQDLIIKHCPDEFTLTITTRIFPQANTKLSGLYRTKQLFCTQCEAEGFRRITYFLDRPDVLASFTTRITADKATYPVLLSNGNRIEQGASPDGRHWAIWQDPFKKPSYLFALVAGNLVCVSDRFITCSGREIALQIYTELGNEDKCQHAMNSLKKAMRWDEQEYGREYDLDLFMIVAVHDFNMGAMENKGLNIFNSKYVLARPDTATDQDYADIEGVIAHEYFHNWTGNRITCRDWFQLSLKEGLTVFRDQEFSRDMNSRDVNRILDVKSLLTTQFPEDAGAMAHPVRPESYEEINNFYTATIYNKGAEVIRMQQTLLGKDGFRKGMDLYFQRHDGQAVTIDDFVAVMEDANAVDLTQFKRWYSQAGTPEVVIDSSYEAGTLTLTLKQFCRPTAECKSKLPFHIPIRLALFSADGKQLPINQEILELKDYEQSFQFNNLAEKPLISLLRDFSAPIILQQTNTQQELIDLLCFESDGYAKWSAAQKLAINSICNVYLKSIEDCFLSDDLIAAYQQVLMDESLDRALRAELLSPPGFEELVAVLSPVEPSLLETARDNYYQQLGKALFSSLFATYNALWQMEDHTMEGTAYSRRRLRNVCLSLLMKADEAQAIPICQRQFEQAKTMSDELASFYLLVNSKQYPIRLGAIDKFYCKWAGNELVLDKWLAIQACCDAPGTLAQVKQLLEHPSFNLKNPNKVRSLIGGFTQYNPRNFHAGDGSGYQFLTDMLIKIDAINPQIAARLATPFTRKQFLTEHLRSLINEQLRYLEQANLSRDLREVVTKSIEC
ncbi:MAG: aminopeptidase N [Legionella sp.]